MSDSVELKKAVIKVYTNIMAKESSIQRTQTLMVQAVESVGFTSYVSNRMVVIQGKGFKVFINEDGCGAFATIKKG